MLTIVTGGGGWFIRDGERTTIAAGMVGLVLPRSSIDEDPGLLMADPDDPYDHYYCRFGGTLAKQTAAQVARNHGAADGGFFEVPRLTDLAAHLDQIITHDHADRPHTHAAKRERPTLTSAESLLLFVLSRLEESPRVESLGMDAAALRRYLSDHLAEPTDLGVMADAFAVSKSHLCRVARQALGETIVGCAVRMKMDWARVLLAEPSLSVKQVARRVGYVDPLYFSRVFKRHAGLNPRGWRRQRGIGPPANAD